jgi:predicted enzyme related to lactoylglutathione lyase
VGGIDAAADRVRSAGGAIRMGPVQVPGGSWIVQATDPQGALFALVSQSR